MSEKDNRRLQRGMVVSDKMDKTVTVSIERTVRHPVYKKYIKKSSKVLAHDEKEICHVGDFVEIKEVRPMSKRKNWLVVKIVKEAKKGFTPAGKEETENGSEAI